MLNLACNCEKVQYLRPSSNVTLVLNRYAEPLNTAKMKPTAACVCGRLLLGYSKYVCLLPIHSE